MIVANYYWFYFEEYSALRYVFLHQFCGICKNVYYGSWELSGDPASINLTSNLMRVCLCVLRKISSAIQAVRDSFFPRLLVGNKNIILSAFSDQPASQQVRTMTCKGLYFI